MIFRALFLRVSLPELSLWRTANAEVATGRSVSAGVICVTFWDCSEYTSCGINVIWVNPAQKLGKLQRLPVVLQVFKCNTLFELLRTGLNMHVRVLQPRTTTQACINSLASQRILDIRLHEQLFSLFPTSLYLSFFLPLWCLLHFLSL